MSILSRSRKMASSCFYAIRQRFGSTASKLGTWDRSDCMCLMAVLYTISVAAALTSYLAWISPSSASPLEYGCEKEFEPMSTTEARFQKNLPIVGNRSFARAKLIDLGWDIGIGHGGRLLHGWIFYYVSAHTITWILEYSALPYSVLLSCLFQAGTLISLWSLIISIRTIQGARAVIKSGLLVFAISHILFLPHSGAQQPDTKIFNSLASQCPISHGLPNIVQI